MGAQLPFFITQPSSRCDKEQLLPPDTPLVGFGGTKVFPIETITLLVIIGTYPKQLTR